MSVLCAKYTSYIRSRSYRAVIAILQLSIRFLVLKLEFFPFKDLETRFYSIFCAYNILSLRTY